MAGGGIYIGILQTVFLCLGQFRNKEVHIRGDITETKSEGLLYLPSHPDRTATVVESQKRFNSVRMSKMDCWYVNHHGRGLLDGEADDYFVESFTYPYLAKNLTSYLPMKRSHRRT